MNEWSDRNVLIIEQRGWASAIGIPLAQRFNSMGANISALIIGAKAKKAVELSGLKWHHTFFADDVKFDPVGYLAERDTTLDQICAELEIDSIWELVQASRYHVKDFEQKWYFGFKQGRSDTEIIAYFKSIFLYSSELLDLIRPDVVITPNFAGLQHIIINLLCKIRNIPMVGFIDSKITGITLTTTDYCGRDGKFFYEFSRISKPTWKVSQSINASSGYGKSVAIPDKPELKIFSKHNLKLFIRSLLHTFSVFRTGVPKKRVSLDQYDVFTFLKIIWSQQRCERYCDYYCKDLDSIKGKLIFFPLQVQPEATIDIFSSRFNNQIETARQVAMSLPGDYRLVVKDHPSMSNKRPPSYLAKLASTPNVTLLSSKVNSSVILDMVDLVITPGGTIVFEAVLKKRPVIQLGNLGTTKLLPGVHNISDWSDLAKSIKRIVTSSDLSNSEYQKELGKYIEAANRVGYHGRYYELAESLISKTDESIDNVCSWIINDADWYITRAINRRS